MIRGWPSTSGVVYWQFSGGDQVREAATRELPVDVAVVAVDAPPGAGT